MLRFFIKKINIYQNKEKFIGTFIDGIIVEKTLNVVRMEEMRKNKINIKNYCESFIGSPSVN